ncbi:MAG: hypothetical protein ACC662_06240 [Planctomycetota bacterium]
MRIRRALALFLATGLLLGACGDDASRSGDPEPASSSAASQSDDPAAPAAAPDQDALVQVLRDLLAALEADDAGKAVGFLAIPSSMSEESARKAVGSWIRRREISAGGIDLLAANGRFGLLADVFGAEGGSWAKRAGVDVAKCYGLALGDAAVASFWNGKTFKILRIDDVGKLK